MCTGINKSVSLETPSSWMKMLQRDSTREKWKPGFCTALPEESFSSRILPEMSMKRINVQNPPAGSYYNGS